MPQITTIYKIKSAEFAAKGEKFQTVHKGNAEAKLAEVRATLDPQARLLAIPVAR